MLTEKDFKINRAYNYYSYKNNEIEICLEPCLNGFDVALYDLNRCLLKEKICTNLKDKGIYSRLYFVFSMAKAIMHANDLYLKYYDSNTK